MTKINLLAVLLMSVFSITLTSSTFSVPIEVSLSNGTIYQGDTEHLVKISTKLGVKIGKIIQVTPYNIKLKNANGKNIIIDKNHIQSIANYQIEKSTQPFPQNSDETSTENNSDATSQKGSPTNEVDSADFRWVMARGAGMSSDEAKNDAWRNAIEQVAGVLITSRSQIENEQLVEDKITAHSNAYIAEFQLIDENIENGIVRVQINAKVAIKILFEHLSKDSDSLEFRNTDGASMYASIVTQNQRTKSAIETLPAAMQGYPEELFDIEIGKTRMAMQGVFDDGKEHLIVPVTFSWNNKAWTTFSNNLKEYLRHVSSETSSFKLRLQGLRLGASHTRHQVDSSLFSKDSWYKQGWERASLAGERSILGRFQINEKLKGMYDFETVYNQVVKSYTHDYIKDVVVILDSRLKSGKSFAVSRDVWDSLMQRMLQIPAFYLNAMTSDGTDIGEALHRNEFLYTTSNTSGDTTTISSLPTASGVNTLFFNKPDSITDFDYHDFVRNSKNKSPRVIVFAPYFQMQVGRGWPYNFNYSRTIYSSSEYTYDYIIVLDLDEVGNVDRVEIERYVLDLHKKRRRENGEE